MQGGRGRVQKLVSNLGPKIPWIRKNLHHTNLKNLHPHCMHLKLFELNNLWYWYMVWFVLVVVHLGFRVIPAPSGPFALYVTVIGIFESPKCDVNPQPNTRGIGPLVGRTSGNRRSVMHVLTVIFNITYHFFFICQYIFIQVILSGTEIYLLLMYPSTFLVF